MPAPKLVCALCSCWAWVEGSKAVLSKAATNTVVIPCKKRRGTARQVQEAGFCGSRVHQLAADPMAYAKVRLF